MMRKGTTVGGKKTSVRPRNGNLAGYPNLLNLSTELLLLIAEAVDYKHGRQGLSPLRLLNRLLYGVVTPLYWKRYTFDSDSDDLDGDLVRLSENPRVARLILRYKIVFAYYGNSEPVYRLPFVVFGFLATTSLSQLTSLILEFETDFDGDAPPQVPQVISDALSSFKHLTRLQLGPCKFVDGFNLREAVPSLRNLVLDCWNGDPSMLHPSTSRPSHPQKPVAPLTSLELLGTEDGTILAQLVEASLESLRVLKLGGVGELKGLDGGERPNCLLPYLIYRRVSEKIESIERSRSVVMPLERLELSTWQAFRPAKAEELKSDDAEEEMIAPQFRSDKFALGDLLELLSLYAPNFRHLKIKDYGDIFKFPLGRELNPWPLVHGITELELVATPKDELKLLLVEPVTQPLRTFFSRLPSLTHLYLTGFIEPSTPRSLLQNNDVSFSLANPAIAVFLLMLIVEFPLVDRVEFRWRGEQKKEQAVFCIKREGSFERCLYSEY